MIRREPRAELRPLASTLWWSARPNAHMEEREDTGARELVVPTGSMHLVIRLGGPELRIFSGPDDDEGACIRGPIVGGVRDRAYLRERDRPPISIGLMLRPGAARALFGVSAEELAFAHHPLDELWGSRARSLIDELSELSSPEAQLARFEAMVIEELTRRGARPPDKRVLIAAEALSHGARVDAIASALELSPRRLHTLFIEECGLSPKRFARVKRVEATLKAALEAPARSWAALAAAYNFSDQAHLSRELREIAGVTPSQLRRLAPAETHHLPMQDRAPQKLAPLPISSRRST